MSNPPLNIEYWASLYEWSEDDNDEYTEGLDNPDLHSRAESLWDWKDLGRGISYTEVESHLKDLEMEKYLEKSPSEAVDSLRSELQDRDIIKSDVLVTPAFLLHLAASDSDGASARYPIYDRRVWNAYVYLWDVRGSEKRLYSDASNSPDLYEDFCEAFYNSCPSNIKPRRYEQALFMFGQFIMGLGEQDKRTSISEITETLSSQESSLQKSLEDHGFALVNRD